MGELTMAVREKEAWGELEKGEYPHSVRHQEIWMPWRDAGLAVYYKVRVSIAEETQYSH